MSFEIGEILELKVIENRKNVTHTVVCTYQNTIKRSLRMSSIENFTYNCLDHQLILSIQGNWPLIGEIGSLL